MRWRRFDRDWKGARAYYTRALESNASDAAAHAAFALGLAAQGEFDSALREGRKAQELDPLLGIRAGVLRSLDERGPWHPEQRITVEDALQATCVTPAWLAGDERRRGRLLPGYLADLVVLDRDPVV